MVKLHNHRLVFSVLFTYFYDMSIILHMYYRSREFHYFVKMALTKSPRKRPTAEKLLQVQYQHTAILIHVSTLVWEAVLILLKGGKYGCTVYHLLYLFLPLQFCFHRSLYQSSDSTLMCFHQLWKWYKNSLISN